MTSINRLIQKIFERISEIQFKIKKYKNAKFMFLLYHMIHMQKFAGQYRCFYV